MKYLFFVFAFGIFFQNAKGAIELSQAMNDKLISAEFRSKGIHSGESVILKIKNLSAKSIEIQITPGLYLKHEDDVYQDHVVVDEMILVLKGNEEKESVLHAFCTERSNACPVENSKFTLGVFKTTPLAILCSIINKNKQYNYCGQEAIWTIINNESPNQVVGDDSAVVMQIRNFIGTTLKKPVQAYKKEEYERPLVQVEETLYLESQGNFYVREVNAGDSVTCAVYDENNMAISEIKKSVVEENRWKKHNVIWHFKMDNLNPAHKFYFRIDRKSVV